MAENDPLPTSADLQKLLDLQDEFLRGKAREGQIQGDINAAIQGQRNLLEKMMELATGLVDAERKIALHKIKTTEEEEKYLEMASRYYANTTDKELAARREEQALINGIQLLGIKLGLEQDIIDAKKQQLQEEIAAQKSGQRWQAWADFFKQISNTIDISFQGQLLAAKGQAAALSRGAAGQFGTGLTQTGAGGAAAQLFSGIPTGVMGPIERVKAFSDILEKAPRLAGAGADSMRTFFGTMGYFGSSVDESLGLLIKSSRELRLGPEEMAKVQLQAGTISKALGLSAKETNVELLNMTSVLRQAGGNSQLAAQILNVFSKDVKVLGQELSSIEKMNLAKMFSGISSLPIDKVLGLTMYANTKALQDVTEEDLSNGEIFKTATAVWQDISSSVGSSYGEQLAATQKIGQLLGVNVNSARDVAALQKIMERSLTGDEFMKEVETLADPTRATAKGIESLKQMIDPLKAIENHTKAILATVNPIVGLFQGFVGAAGAAKLLPGGVESALGFVSAMGAPWLRRTIVRYGAGALAGPAVGTALVVGATGLALTNAYRSHQRGMEGGEE